MNNILEDVKENEVKSIASFFDGILSKEYINEQADANIKSIVYADLPEGLNGDYSYLHRQITINKNIDENAKKICLIHEMLHAITFRSETSKGFKRLNDNGITSQGIGLDEIITENIAEEITGAENRKIFKFIRPIYVLLEKAIGKEPFIRDYALGTNTVKNEIEKKYGEDARASI